MQNRDVSGELTYALSCIPGTEGGPENGVEQLSVLLWASNALLASGPCHARLVEVRHPQM